MDLSTLTAHGQMLGDQAIAAMVISWLIEKAKDIQWIPLLHADSDRLNKVVGVLMALVTSAGIHFTFDPDAASLTITGLSAATVLAGLWEGLKQFVMQQVAYHKLIKKEKVKEAPIVYPEQAKAAAGV